MMNSNNPQINNIYQSHQNPRIFNNNYQQNMMQNFKNMNHQTDNTNRNNNNYNFQDNKMNSFTDIKNKINNNNNFQNYINNGNHNNNNNRNDNYEKNFNNYGNYQSPKNNGNYNEKNEQNKFNNYLVNNKNLKNIDNNESNPKYENINKNNNDKQKENKFIPKKHKPNLQDSIICNIIKITESIDSNETNVIKSIVELLYSTYSNNNKKTLSTIISENIKNKLGGEWFVFISKKNSKISLNFTTVSESDFLVINIGQSLLKIAKTK